MYKKLPNILTISRIAIIPFFVAAFFIPSNARDFICFMLFLYASVTDFLDGYLARKWKVESDFGRFLDPIADKIIVAVALIMLVKFGKAEAIATILILSRELLISGLREFMGSREVIIHVSKLAKWKTTIQLVAILFLLIINIEAVIFGISAIFIGNILLWIAAILTVITGYQYIKSAMNTIGKK